MLVSLKAEVWLRKISFSNIGSTVLVLLIACIYSCCFRKQLIIVLLLRYMWLTFRSMVIQRDSRVVKRQNNWMTPSLFSWAPWSIYLLVENCHILLYSSLIGLWSITSGYCLISQSFPSFIWVGIVVLCSSRKDSLVRLTPNSHSQMNFTPCVSLKEI